MQMIKSGIRKWKGHAENMGLTRNIRKFQTENLKEEDTFVDLEIDGRIILN
jgi:hypothetical protein